MSASAKGRFPYKSAWAFKGGRNSGRFEFLRTEIRDTKNSPVPWQDYFLGNDGYFNNRVQRWDGTAWVKTDIKIYNFQ